MRIILAIILLGFIGGESVAQKLALRSDRAANVKVDGKSVGLLEDEQVKVIPTSMGEHIIQAVTPG